MAEKPPICTFILCHFYEIITEIGQKKCFRTCPEYISHDALYVHWTPLNKCRLNARIDAFIKCTVLVNFKGKSTLLKLFT